MTERIALITFQSSWFLLLFIAILAQVLFEDRPKRQAGLAINLIVIIPFILIFGLFYLGRYFGTYEGSLANRIAGTVIVFLGVIGYILSHLYLRKNWSLFASIKEGQQLVTNGPYRFVRHPNYSSVTVVFLGSGLLVANYMMIIFTPVVGIIYYLRAMKEEKLLKEEFHEYDQYAKATRMFIPGIF